MDAVSLLAARHFPLATQLIAWVAVAGSILLFLGLLGAMLLGAFPDVAPTGVEVAPFRWRHARLG